MASNAGVSGETPRNATGIEVAEASLQRALRHMFALVGMTYAQVSRAINRNARYIPNMLNNAVTPRADTMSKIANACGYKLVLVGHGEGLEIVPEHFVDSYADSTVKVRRLWKVETIQDNQSVIADELHFIPADVAGLPVGNRPSVWRIDWQNVESETEEEFEQRDPEGYAEYRREVDAFQNDYYDQNS